MIRFFCCISLFISIFCHAGNDFILSSKIKIEYETPESIFHGEDILIVKYEGWYFSHEIVNPKSIYPSIDLSGLEIDYIKSLFEESVRDTFPRWLSELASEQSNVFGIAEGNYSHVKKKKL